MRLRLAACFLAVCMTAPLVAAAQPTAISPKSDAMTDQARELFVKGAGLYEQRQYERAEAAFLAAWVLKKHFQIAGNLGRCEMKLGKLRNAAEHLAFFLKGLPPSGNEEERKRAQALFVEAREKVAVVEIRVDVSGAEVRVDGRAIGAAPLAAEVFVEPGKRTIEATRNGYQDAREVIDASAGASMSVSLKLQPFVSPLPVQPPLLPPPRSLPPPPGDEPARQPNKAVIISGTVATGLAAGLGVVSMLLANSKAGDADDRRDAIAAAGGEAACLGASFAEECAALHGLRQSASTFTNIAGWAFIGAGVVGVGTLIYALASPRKAGAPTVQAAPMVTSQGGGLSLTGQW